MIRTRLGVATIGSGGSAGDYIFDSDGLSKDPRLAYYLQSLTPAQLQLALDGGDPGPMLQQLLTDAANATGPGALPCGTPDNPTCGPAGGFSLSSVPLWAWLAGGSVGALLILRK